MVSPVNPGKVEWSGENPGIYLKDDEGNWTTLAVFSRSSRRRWGQARAYWSLARPSRRSLSRGKQCLRHQQSAADAVAHRQLRLPIPPSVARGSGMPPVSARDVLRDDRRAREVPPGVDLQQGRRDRHALGGSGRAVRRRSCARDVRYRAAPDVQRVRRGTARHYRPERRSVAGQNHPEEFSGPADEHCVSRFLRDLDYPATLIAASQEPVRKTLFSPAKVATNGVAG